VLTDVAEALRLTALEAWMNCRDDEPCNTKVVVGQWALDECCCGVLVVSLDQFTWWNPFPFDAFQRGGLVAIPFAPSAPCMGTLGALATIHVGLCVPVVDDRGLPPPAGAESSAMIEVADLAQCIAKAVVCAGDDCWVIGGTAFQGAEGGCLLAQIAVRLDDCPVAPTPR
jgi:hypothetical protein